MGENRMKKARQLALSAILAAFGVALLYLASFFPVLSLSLIAIAGLLPGVAVIECGVAAGAGTYAVACALALLLVPDKSCAILYALLFGCYPLIKYFAERLRPVLAWAAKLAAVNALLALLFFAFRAVLLEFIPDHMMIFLTFLVFNIVFILYDLCFSKLSVFYMARIHPHVAGRR
mgnify:FL=1